MQIEHCPYCIMKGIESECEWDKDAMDKKTICCKNPACNYSFSTWNENKDVILHLHNAVSLAVRESMWTKFDPNDESTYPPHRSYPEVTVQDKENKIKEFVDLYHFINLDSGKYAWTGNNTKQNLIVKAWRIPTPYKEKE